MLKKQKGFSLIELLLVLLFMGLIAAMAINSTMRTRHRWALRNTAREITSMFYQARQQASRENAPVMLDFADGSYSLHIRRSGVWEKLKSEFFGEKVTVTKTPADTTGFAIAPSGFLLRPDTMAICGMQTLVVRAPHQSEFDTITINIYPYGGVRATQQFK
jgi:type II secretion system protein H